MKELSKPNRKKRQGIETTQANLGRRPEAIGACALGFKIRLEVPGALTGRPQVFNSSKSLTLPPTTQPIAPLVFIRKAIMPPMAAHDCISGCSITTTVPSSVRSTQCSPFGIALGSDSGSGLVTELLDTSLSVEAGPMILGCPVKEPNCCGKGANGTDAAINLLREEAIENKLTYVCKIPCTMYLTTFWLLQPQQGISNLKGSACQFQLSSLRDNASAHITCRV